MLYLVRDKPTSQSIKLTLIPANIYLQYQQTHSFNSPLQIHISPSNYFSIISFTYTPTQSSQINYFDGMRVSRVDGRFLLFIDPQFTYLYACQLNGNDFVAQKVHF